MGTAIIGFFTGGFIILIIAIFVRLNAKYPPIRDNVCPECLGSGFVTNAQLLDTTCTTCNGTGVDPHAEQRETRRH